MKKFLLGNINNISAQSYIWNSIGGLLNAGQSALLLMVISRTNPVEDAGIYSIGYAIACLALTIGCFGIRNYQVTDTNKKYTFSNYFSARIVTDVGMVLLIAYYVFKGYFLLGYSIQKCLVIVLLGILKVIDSIEDVFYGMYQNQGRLDIAARCGTTRYCVMLASFSSGLLVTQDLIISAALAVVLSLFYFILVLKLTFPMFKQRIIINIKDKKIVMLLLENFSLFLGGFFALYIANAPKYAIDEFRTGGEQACFNYIFMPIYVVNVLNTFIYQPMLARMASIYNDNKKKEFIRLFMRQIGIIVLLISIILASSYLLGIPTLSLFFNTDLTEYKKAFMILMIGSGFLATEGYIAAIITIMRKQVWLILGYLSTAILVVSLANKVVLVQGVLGASMLYTCGIWLQMMIFGCMFVFFYSCDNNRS